MVAVIVKEIIGKESIGPEPCVGILEGVGRGAHRPDTSRRAVAKAVPRNSSACRASYLRECRGIKMSSTRLSAFVVLLLGPLAACSPTPNAPPASAGAQPAQALATAPPVVEPPADAAAADLP